jgi:5-formyltetrahydrofolate cyclo-ligase
MKSMDKKTLREYVLNRRKNIPVEDQIITTEILIEKLKKTAVFQASKHVGLYYPIHQEINLLSLIDLYPDKSFYLPNIENGNIKYRLLERLYSLVEAPFSLKEAPHVNPSIDDCDLYLVPCVATCGLLRIGYGKGYFDHFFVGKKGYKMGITYPAFKYDFNLVEPHDILMDEVL